MNEFMNERTNVWCKTFTSIKKIIKRASKHRNNVMGASKDKTTTTTKKWN